MLKIVSWNVNGYMAMINKNFKEIFKNMNADIFCIQETKLQKNQEDKNFAEGYKSYWNYSEKKGYSGTAVFTKINPIDVKYGFGINDLDQEGRLITLEFEEYFLVNTYTPCFQKNLERQNYRATWDDEFLEYIKELKQDKEVIICGDLNVAYKDIDIGSFRKELLGFGDEERYQFSKLLDLGLIDSFRYKNPYWKKYTWWRNNNRENKNGCRLDYFLISQELKENIVNTQIRSEIGGSDHCPIVLKMKNI